MRSAVPGSGGLSSIIGGVGKTAATVTSAAAPAIATSADPMADIERQVRSATGDPAALRDAAVAAVQAAVTGDEATAEEARNRAADAIAKAQNIPCNLPDITSCGLKYAIGV
jgi:hypothetical protein